MGWIESLMCWFRPSHWRDRHAHQSPQYGAADQTETTEHDAPEFTDHDVSDPGVT